VEILGLEGAIARMSVKSAKQEQRFESIMKMADRHQPAPRITVRR